MKPNNLLFTRMNLLIVMMGLSFMGLSNPNHNDFNGRSTNEWTIVATYEIPADASGLAYDGTNLFCGIYGSEGDRIYQIDPANGDYELLCNAPIDDALGLTFDGTYFWSVYQGSSSSDDAVAIQFDYDGNQVGSFPMQTHYMSGIASDGGDFWTAAYYNPDGHIYKTTETGVLLDDFAAPDNQPWDLTVQDEFLWMADYWGDALYKIEKATGDLIETYDTEGVDPAGVVWDGNYLWYVDAGEGADSWLYKVDLSGAGQPVITLPSTTHGYGLVNIGDAETWDMVVQNTGAANLTISGVDIDNDLVTTSQSFPVVIEPADQIVIPITYSPEEFEALEETILVLSDDPLNSEAEVLLTGNGVYEGPRAAFESEDHDYYAIRESASERWYVAIENQGDEVLSITEINIDNPVFYLDNTVELPITIPVLGEVEVGIWFLPPGLETYYGKATFSTNDPLSSLVDVFVEGEGEEAPDEMGAQLWYFNIEDDYDSSPKAFDYIQDINDDGKHEVIIASEDNYVRCVNGDGDDLSDLLWKTEIYSGNVYGQNCLKRSADLNGDGIQDVVIGTTGGDRSIWALSGKDGQQIWRFDTDMYGDGGWVYQVDIKYDYNADGIPDALGCAGDDSEDSGPKRVFCIDGVTGELIWDEYTGGPAFSVKGVSDFTGDGVADVIAGASNESESEGSVKGINGATGETEWSYVVGGSSVWALESMSDINADDVKDVIAGDYSGNFYLIDPTDGSVLEQGSIGNELILRFERVSSLNDDIFDDIVAAHSGTVMSAIDGSTGDFIWSKALEDKCWNVRGINDVNGDDVVDVAVATLYQNNYAYILSGSTGSVILQESLSEPSDGLGIIPDITGDGSYEIIPGGRYGSVKCLSGGTILISDIPMVSALEKVQHNASPNPFANELTISFKLQESQQVAVKLTDLQGRSIKLWPETFYFAGENTVQLQEMAEGLKSGVYIYTITTEEESYSGKIVKK